MTEQERQQVILIFEVLKNSKVPLKTFGAVLDISRTTLHNWKRGNNISDKLRLRLAYNVARRLNEAVRDGKLPLPADNNRTAGERITEIKSILRQTQ